jgi:hypothetical protein
MPLITSDLEFSDDYPTIEPSLKLDFANARALDPRITFTRASTATYVGANGLIKTAGDDEARFDHDPATGESLGLLIEESRTNLLRRSAEFDNTGGWTSNSNATASPSITSPDGTTTGYLITNSNSVAYSGFYQDLIVQSNTTYTLSVYQKGYENTRTRFGMWSYSNTNWYAHSEYDWTNGIPSLFTTTGISTDEVGSITDVGGGWYRTILTFTTGVETSCKIEFHSDRSGTGLSSYFWGIQLEVGTFPTSYIPTSGSTATRALEYGYTTNMDFYNQNEGSIFSEVSLLDVGNTGGKVIWSFNVVGGFGEGIYMVNENGGTGINHVLYDNSVNQYSRSNVVGSISANQFYKTIYSQQTNNVNSAGDGSVGTDDTSATLPTIGRLVIGNNAWGSSPLTNGLNPSNCHMKSFSYYPKRLTNAQLQTLTQ